MELIIANKNYSSWSLRGWLMLAAYDLPFKETLLPLFTDSFYQTLADIHVPGKVPVLIDDKVTVWDSLAICEYVSEQHLDGKGWPEDASIRARARSVASEMHSGFGALRSEMPMNCRAKRRVNLSEAALKDVARVEQIWSELQEEFAHQGPWLFGQFSIVDVMFAPVVMRFSTYELNLKDSTRQYMATLRQHPAMQKWLEAALAEVEIVEEDEVGEDIS